MSQKHFNIAVFAFFAAIMVYTYVLSKRANPVFLPQPRAEVPDQPVVE